MRYAFLLGGGIGFCLTLLGGWFAGRSPEQTFVEAAIGCLICAYVFRWMGSIMASVFQQTLDERKAVRVRVATDTKDSSAINPNQSQS